MICCHSYHNCCRGCYQKDFFPERSSGPERDEMLWVISRLVEKKETASAVTQWWFSLPKDSLGVHQGHKQFWLTYHQFHKVIVIPSTNEKSSSVPLSHSCEVPGNKKYPPSEDHKTMMLCSSWTPRTHLCGPYLRTSLTKWILIHQWKRDFACPSFLFVTKLGLLCIFAVSQKLVWCPSRHWNTKSNNTNVSIQPKTSSKCANTRNRWSLPMTTESLTSHHSSLRTTEYPGVDGFQELSATAVRL